MGHCPLKQLICFRNEGRLWKCGYQHPSYFNSVQYVDEPRFRPNSQSTMTTYLEVRMIEGMLCSWVCATGNTYVCPPTHTHTHKHTHTRTHTHTHTHTLEWNSFYKHNKLTNPNNHVLEVVRTNENIKISEYGICMF